MEIDPNFLNIDTKNLTKQKFQNLNNVDIKNMEDKKLKEVCNDFEAFFMQQFLDISLKNTKIAGEGTGSEIIKGMYSEALGKASAGSAGISDILYNFLINTKKH